MGSQVVGILARLRFAVKKVGTEGTVALLI